MVSPCATGVLRFLLRAVEQYILTSYSNSTLPFPQTARHWSCHDISEVYENVTNTRWGITDVTVVDV